MSNLINNHLMKQIVKFVFVGGTATLLDYGIFWYLVYPLGMYHQFAATIAFVIATFYNYYMSMKFVFTSKFEKHEKHKEMVAFFVLSGIGWLITVGGLAIFVDWLKMDPMIGKIIVGVFVMAFNFVSRKIYFEK